MILALKAVFKLKYTRIEINTWFFFFHFILNAKSHWPHRTQTLNLQLECRLCENIFRNFFFDSSLNLFWVFELGWSKYRTPFHSDISILKKKNSSKNCFYKQKYSFPFVQAQNIHNFQLVHISNNVSTCSIK